MIKPSNSLAIRGAVVIALLAATSAPKTALAGGPEPAQLTAQLSDVTGGTASAWHVRSNTATFIVRWPSLWMINKRLSAGQPCADDYLYPGQQTRKTIQRQGDYVICQ